MSDGNSKKEEVVKGQYVKKEISKYVQNAVGLQKRNRETVGAIAENGMRTGQS